MRAQTLARLLGVASVLSGLLASESRAQYYGPRASGAPTLGPAATFPRDFGPPTSSYYGGGAPVPGGQVPGGTERPRIELQRSQPRTHPNGRLRNNVTTSTPQRTPASYAPAQVAERTPQRGSSIYLVQSDMPTPAGTSPGELSAPRQPASPFQNQVPRNAYEITDDPGATTSSAPSLLEGPAGSTPAADSSYAGSTSPGDYGLDGLLEPSCGFDDLGSYGAPCGTCGRGACDGMACGAGHRWEMFAEFLYLRPRDAQVAYAVPIDGPIAANLGNGIQVGPTAIVDPNHNAGFRVGGGIVLSDCALLGAEFIGYQSHISDIAFVAAPDVMRSLVAHPLGANAATDGLRAAAQLDIDFQNADLIYRTATQASKCLRIDYLMGVRYANLEQEFASQFSTNGTTFVNTDISYNGTGPLVGLRFNRDIGSVGLALYGRGEAAFLVGKSDAYYRQSDTFAGNQVFTRWESGRVVSQLGMEAGVSWSAPDDVFTLSAGYMVSAWYNVVRTDEFVQSVQYNDYVGLGDGLTFDGFVLRGELKF